MNRQVLVLVAFILGAGICQAQVKIPPVDKSPMDMSYYPANYPVLKVQNKATEPLLAKVIYSRPQKNGRVVFGELVEYGKVWRLGANEATEIDLFKDAKIGGNKLKKGKYTVFAIPYQDKWIIIFNKDTDVWGAFQYDSKKDVLRIDVKPEKITEIAESFSIVFEKNSTGANMVIAWDDTAAKIPFSWQ